VNGFEFTNYDDTLHVTANPYVRQGLTAAGIGWAFRTFQAGNWYPLTWLSHMADVSLFGLRAGGHHLTSLLLHAANAVLLLLLLRRATGALWRPALVAALFALHPLHVESVAWVSARKDVLSTLFFLLALLAYLAYARRPAPRAYAAVVGLFALGLMAKPMVVTLPLVLVLLDLWPLDRWQLSRADAAWGARCRRAARAELLEKGPLLCLAAAIGAITVIAQRAGGAVKSLASYPFGVRLENALVSAATYIADLFAPVRLAVNYPHPGAGLAGWRIVAAAVLLVAVTALALRCARRAPSLPFGWVWYLLTLAPVIGLVQVGDQARADRYTYLPQIGLLVMLAWVLGEARSVVSRATAAAGSVAALVVLAALSRSQLEYWRDSIALFSHTVAVTTDNVVAQVNLGIALAEAGRTEEALGHYREALRLNPQESDALTNTGIVLAAQHRDPEAIALFERALRMTPGSAAAHYNLATALQRAGRDAEAVRHYRQALAITPDDADAHNNLGALLGAAGAHAEALEHFLRALALAPELEDVRFNAGLVLEQLGRPASAAALYREQLERHPGDVEVRERLDALGAAGISR
jgi:tetratricopeptide (TPR) repeat protein